MVKPVNGALHNGEKFEPQEGKLPQVINQTKQLPISHDTAKRWKEVCHMVGWRPFYYQRLSFLICCCPVVAAVHFSIVVC